MSTCSTQTITRKTQPIRSEVRIWCTCISLIYQRGCTWYRCYYRCCRSWEMTSQSRDGCEESWYFLYNTPMICRKSEADDERCEYFCITDTIRYEVTHMIYTNTSLYGIYRGADIPNASITLRCNLRSLMKWWGSTRSGSSLCSDTSKRKALNGRGTPDCRAKNSNLWYSPK